MGHDLVLGVNSWEATVEGGDSPSISLTADPGSVEVIEGSGGAKPLGDKDKADIKKSIGSKVLGSSQITFTSSSVDDKAATRQGRPLDRRQEQLGERPAAGRRRQDLGQHHAEPEGLRHQAVLGDDGRIEGQEQVRSSSRARSRRAERRAAGRAADAAPAPDSIR